MPLNATPITIYRGVNPPLNPSTTTLWKSQSAQYFRVSDSYEDRKVVVTGDAGGFQSFIAQEPKVFYNSVLGNWGMYFSGLTGLGYATASSPSGPWTKYTSGGTVVEIFSNLTHGRIYVEGTTIYFTYADLVNGLFKVATASLSTPQTLTAVGTVFTPPSNLGFSAGQLGNSRIVKANGLYYLFFELIVDGFVGQLGYATCSTVTGTYTMVSYQMVTLWTSFHTNGVEQNSGELCGGPMPIYENGIWIMFYHSGINQGSSIYRATSTDLINWTIDNYYYTTRTIGSTTYQEISSQPWIRRLLPIESSQCADINLAQGPNESWHAYWTAYNNVAGVASIVYSPILEPLLQWTGTDWNVIDASPSPTVGEFTKTDQAYVYSTSTVTANCGDDMLCDPGALGSNMTVILPYADFETHPVRITNVSTTGAFYVSVTAQSGDTIILGSPAIANGASMSFYCRIQNYWTQSYTIPTSSWFNWGDAGAGPGISSGVSGSVGVTSLAGTINQITTSSSSGNITLSLPSTIVTPGILQVGSTLQISSTNSISAAGTTQGTGTVLTTDYNVVTTTGSGTGVVLPGGLAGQECSIVNRGANALLVYPASGDAIDGLATNIAVSVPAGQTYVVKAITSSQWYTVDPTYVAGSGLSVTVLNGVLTYTNTGATAIAGTTNEITASASTGSITLSLPSAVTLPGTLTMTGQLNLATGTTTVKPLVFTSGTLNTSPAAGVYEYDGTNSYITNETTSGRGLIPVEQYFHLASNGGTITTIANFFGTTSNISLVSGAYYDIEIVCYFTMGATASVLTWSLTNSAAPTALNLYYEMSPVGGIVAPPGTATMLVGQILNGTTAAQTVVTASLTGSSKQYVRFRIQLKNGTGTSLKIQVAETTTTTGLTPNIGSYWSCVRLPAGNVGTFAA